MASSMLTCTELVSKIRTMRILRITHTIFVLQFFERKRTALRIKLDGTEIKGVTLLDLPWRIAESKNV